MKINYSFSTQGGFLIHPLVAHSLINYFSKYSWSTYYVPGTRRGIRPVCPFPTQHGFYPELIFCLHTAVWLYQFLKFLSFLDFKPPQCPPANWSLPWHPELLHELRTGSAGTPGHTPGPWPQQLRGNNLFCTSWQVFSFLFIYLFI